MTECPRCGTKLTSNIGISGATASAASGHCPSCGYTGPGAGDTDHFIARYFKALWRVLTQPTAFFSAMPVRGGWGEPLAFALVTHWIGAAIGFLWAASTLEYVNGFVDRFVRFTQQYGGNAIDTTGLEQFGAHRLLNWFMGTGAVIVDPFQTLAMLLVTTFFIWMGARLLVTPGKNGAPQEITFESALRINCYGLAPAILAAFPFVGGLLSLIYMWIVTIIGARSVYRIGYTRASIVALFTHVVICAIIFVGFVIFMFTIFRVMTHG